MVPSRRSVLFSKPDKSTYSYSQNHIHFIECVGWISMSKAKFRKIMLREEISYNDRDYQLVCFRYFHKWNKVLKWIRKNTSTWSCCNRQCGIAFNQRTQYLDSTFLSLTIYPCLQNGQIVLQNLQ